MVLRSSWKSRHKNSCGPAPRWIRPGLAALLWLCAIRLACGIEVGEIKFIVQKDAQFDANYNDTVTSENQTIYAFNHTISRNKVSSPPQTCRFVFSPLKDYYQSFLLFPLLTFRLRECVCLWTCYPTSRRAQSCLWCDRSKASCLFKSPSFSEACEYPPPFTYIIYIHHMYVMYIC